VVREGVERNAKSVWRVLLTAGSDEALTQRTPLIFGKGYSGGALRCELVGPGHACLKLTGWPDMREFALRGMKEGFERLIEIAGRQNVKARAKSQPDGAELNITWKSS